MGRKTVLIYSGGLDSSTLLYRLTECEQKEVMCLNFNYGSKHNEKEREAALKICEDLGSAIRFFDLPLGEFIKSSLMQDGGELPEGEYDAPSMKQTVVPFRNAIMLSIAVGIAESIQFNEVALAIHAGDHHIYPDCRPQFFDSMRKAINFGTDTGIFLYAPYLNYSKSNIIREGYDMGVPYGITWTCYKGGNRHCGVCGACDERKKAFIEADRPDPTDYIK